MLLRSKTGDKIACSTLLFLSSFAARAQVGAPVLGYIPDGANIRPVYGLPGAAAGGEPVKYGRDFAFIAVSPQQDFALATDAASGAVLIASSGNTVALVGATANPDRVVLSPRGSAAVLAYSSTTHLQIFSGLPASPSLREVDATFLRDALSVLAVSDDGQWVAGAWSRGLYAFGPDGEVVQLPMRERAMALAFLGGRHDLAVATPWHVFSIANIGGGAAISTLYTGARAIPAAMALSADNAKLVVADISGEILALDLNSGSALRVDCGCAPEGVFAMGPAVFRLTGLTGGAFRLFDASTGEALFVPLMATPVAGQGDQP